MKTPLSILAFFLALVLILLDLMPSIKEEPAQASSLLTNEGELLLEFLGLGSQEAITITAQPAEVFELPDISALPQALESLEKDLGGIVQVYPAYNLNPTATNPLLYYPQNGLSVPNLSSILPPAGSPLYYAYRQGGSIFYEEGDNVVLIFPNQESLKSYFKSTGFESTFLQETLSYPPIDTPDAIQKYREQYGGTIVAETDTWVLMKFPSGGFLKVAR